METVMENKGKGRILGCNSHLSIAVLARWASREDYAPSELTERWINEINRKLTSEDRKTFRSGIKRFNTLIENRDVLPGITDLLPETYVARPQSLSAAQNPWRRSENHPPSWLIWDQFEEIMHLKQYGNEDLQLEGTPVDFADSSVKAYENTLNWFLRELFLADRLDDNDTPNLADIVTAENLVTACNGWIISWRSKGPPTETSTLHNYVTKLVHLAIKYFDPSDSEVKRLNEIRRKKAIRTESVGGMSESRLKWIKAFANDPEKQAKTHRLPEALMNKANRILALENTAHPPAQAKIMSALRMGITAMQVAILFRVSPVRSSNMRTARFRGEDAEFTIDPRLKRMRLDVPGCQVKNGADIGEFADDDFAPIFEWYINIIRRRLIDKHPYGAANNWVDSDFLFPSTSEQSIGGPMFASNFKHGCKEIVFDMHMHQARHVCAYWILSVDPNAWAEAAALLHISETMLRKYYAWMDTVKASEAARQKLFKERKSIQKHRVGSYAYVE